MGWAQVQQNQADDGIRQILCGIEAATTAGCSVDHLLPILADAYRKIGQTDAGLGVFE
jgi:hypothetical protein